MYKVLFTSQEEIIANKIKIEKISVQRYFIPMEITLYPGNTKPKRDQRVKCLVEVGSQRTLQLESINK